MNMAWFFFPKDTDFGENSRDLPRFDNMHLLTSRVFPLSFSKNPVAEVRLT